MVVRRLYANDSSNGLLSAPVSRSVACQVVNGRTLVPIFHLVPKPYPFFLLTCKYNDIAAQ